MTTASKTAAARLPDIVAAENAISDPAQLGAYAVDGIKPGAAARPGSAEEVAELVKYAARENMGAIATSARTKLAIGMTPKRYDLAIDMARLDRIITYDPHDLTLSVEPGLLLRKMDSALAEHRQFLPMRMPYWNRATVGGTIASGVDTPMRHFYGTPRDYVLGMHFVTGEGARGKSGGLVVKNVTGYDLHKLMIGSLGSLGIITRINFRTFPKPPATRGFLAAFDSADGAIDLRHHIAQSALTPLSLEILSPRVAEIFTSSAAAQVEPEAAPPKMLSPQHWTLTASYAGTENVLERYARDLGRMANESGAASTAVLDDTTRPSVWGRQREFIPIALESSPAAMIVKMAVPPMRMKDALAILAREAEAGGLPWAAMARGLGVIYFALLPQAKSEETLRRMAAAANQILAAGEKLEANAWIPWCPAELKSAVKVWGVARGDFAEMQKVKKAFDPQGILSPGRFVGGM
ncbi:MAG TPA: FAD-binding oxidoreductase [Candidatus Sulfotelmatobacter sp.]|nr:FAD-binding oxidoreductase [Candidatus Sulfotelmatobacter sp.]